jgi:hypothetical protein
MYFSWGSLNPPRIAFWKERREYPVQCGPLKESIMAELKGANRFDYEVVKLLRLTKTDDLMLQTMEFVLEAQMQQFKMEDPDFPDEKFMEKFRQKVDIESLLYACVPVYNRLYTREEIAGLIAFHESPLGRKMNGKSSQILQECMAANQAWLEAIGEKIEKDLDSLSQEGGY